VYFFGKVQILRSAESQKLQNFAISVIRRIAGCVLFRKSAHPGVRRTPEVVTSGVRAIPRMQKLANWLTSAIWGPAGSPTSAEVGDPRVPGSAEVVQHAQLPAILGWHVVTIDPIVAT